MGKGWIVATIVALRRAVATLIGRWSRSPDLTSGHAISRALGSLRDTLKGVCDARAEDIALHGALSATTPWRVGTWQEGEPYEYEPRIPIYDDIGDERFNITAEDSKADVVSVRALALATEIVEAVNMHDRLITTLESWPEPCGPCHLEGACSGPCEADQKYKAALALAKEAKDKTPS